ncbi:MAG: glycoside hydrolase family 20 zincin-like fold domain-containing protein, partial [Terriglobales bacterium]
MSPSLPFRAVRLRSQTLALCASLLALPCLARADELHLLPMPREITQTKSAFAVTAATRIVVARAHAAEDRVAAEMLAEEIARYTGRKPAITVAPAMPAVMRNVIYLVRWEDDARARTLLAAQGLKNFDQTLGEEGYLLLADNSKVLVAGGGGAGVFYGAQTLRQLIRPQGAKAACPGVQIRDWPAMRWRGVHDDISRGPVPTLE